jgi:bifunctional pyridoxal-dependent enzyme with beta-cystathionase and maltose regulon repressor activities
MDKALKTHAPIKPEAVFVADSPTSLGNILGFNLAAPGEGILISRPVYGRFELDYGIEAGVEIVYADTDTEEAFTPDAVEKYEQALADARERGVNIRAVLLVNPHNPVGKFSMMWRFLWEYK